MGDAEVSLNDEAWLQRAFSQLSTPQHLDFAPGDDKMLLRARHAHFARARRCMRSQGSSKASVSRRVRPLAAFVTTASLAPQILACRCRHGAERASCPG